VILVEQKIWLIPQGSFFLINLGFGPRLRAFLSFAAHTVTARPTVRPQGVHVPYGLLYGGEVSHPSGMPGFQIEEVQRFFPSIHIGALKPERYIELEGSDVICFEFEEKPILRQYREMLVRIFGDRAEANTIGANGKMIVPLGHGIRSDRPKLPYPGYLNEHDLTPQSISFATLDENGDIVPQEWFTLAKKELTRHLHLAER